VQFRDYLSPKDLSALTEQQFGRHLWLKDPLLEEALKPRF